MGHREAKNMLVEKSYCEDEQSCSQIRCQFMFIFLDMNEQGFI